MTDGCSINAACNETDISLRTYRRWLSKGEITVDSAAEESVCPKDWGGAFPLKETKRKMNFQTASGQVMQHYGERVVTCITESRPSPRTSPVFARRP
jgi:hypothetical protein